MKVSVFNNFNKVSENLEIPAILEQLKNDKYKNRILQLRKLLVAGNESEYTKQKKSLPAFTPCGLFEGGRKLEFLKEYSGLLILDIDKLDSRHLSNIKQTVQGIAFTYCVFTSPSGYGLKILVKINSSPDHHKLVFNQVKKYYESVLNIAIDPSGKDITRLCFFSWDPKIYINNNAQVFRTTAKLNPCRDVPPERLNLPVSDQIESIIQQIEQHQIDITSEYKDWLSIGFALIDALGAGARQPFHRISRFYHKYNSEECNKQFDKCLNSNNSGITVKSFFHFAKQHGILCKDVPQARLTSNSVNTPLLQPLNTTLTPVHETVTQSEAEGSIQLPQQLGNFQDVPVARLESEKEKTEPTDAIAGKQTDETPKSKKGGTNKFHLVRDYLIENFDIRYNYVSTNFEYKEKEQEFFEPMNENDIFIKMQLDGLSFSLSNLVAFLKSSMVPKYNPFTQYFESLPPWDGKTDFIQELVSFVNLKPELCDRFDKHFKKWLVRVVKCALVDSYFNKQAFILVHDKQNSGKSTICRFLCPPSLKNYIAENLSIDKDSRILLTTNLLINLDELSTLSKVEINSLKSLFSKDKINDRLPYDRKNSIIPRRASFIGSTNQAEFLNDESGSVRWLCFEIRSIDWSYKEKVNIDNIWSQAYTLYKSGFHCDLTPEEIKENEEYNRQFNITTTEYELIHKYLSPGTREHNDCFMTATDILLYLADQTNGKVKLNNINVGRALKMLSFARDKNYPDKNYGYFVFKKIL